jgi:hypothetical protein
LLRTGIHFLLLIRSRTKLIASRGESVAPDVHNLFDHLRQHELLKNVLPAADWSRHHLYPKIAGQPDKFLDLGFGSALWCAEVGQQLPLSSIVREFQIGSLLSLTCI